MTSPSDAAEATANTPASITLPVPQCSAELRFVWQHDRYAHQLWVNDECVLASVEGDSAEDWPASAPVQQLSLEPIEDNATALGVGAAGTSHWSLSVQAQDFGQGQCALVFDWACRVKQAPGFLGSTYQGAWVDRLEPVGESSAAGSGVVTASDGHEGPTRQWRYHVRLS
ncbi:MAG: hypothetical protein AAGA03_01155 [Planctomycetota bacterium]